MLTTKILYSLASFQQADSYCFSLYTNYSSLKNLQQIVKSHLRLTEINISDEIKKYILSTNKTKGTIAIFYAGPKSIKFINLDTPVKDSFFRGNVFNLLPLLDYVTKRPKFSLTIINKNKATLYNFSNEELSEVISIFREIKENKDNSGYYNLSVGASGGITKKKPRYDNLEFEYFSSISSDIQKYNKEKKLKYSIVFSSIKLESNIKDLFDNPYSKVIIDQYDPKKSEYQIIEMCFKLINNEINKNNKKYVEDIIELNYPINKLAINMKDIFNSINERKIDTLFLNKNVKPKSGFYCSRCGYLSNDGDSVCDYCKSEMIYANNIILNIINTCILKKIDINIYRFDPKSIKDKDIFALKIY